MVSLAGLAAGGPVVPSFGHPSRSSRAHGMRRRGRAGRARASRTTSRVTRGSRSLCQDQNIDVMPTLSGSALADVHRRRSSAGPVIVNPASAVVGTNAQTFGPRGSPGAIRRPKQDSASTGIFQSLDPRKADALGSSRRRLRPCRTGRIRRLPAGGRRASGRSSGCLAARTSRPWISTTMSPSSRRSFSWSGARIGRGAVATRQPPRRGRLGSRVPRWVRPAARRRRRLAARRSRRARCARQRSREDCRAVQRLRSAEGRSGQPPGEPGREQLRLQHGQYEIL